MKKKPAKPAKRPPARAPGCAVCAHRNRADITRYLSEDPNALLYVSHRYNMPLADVLVHARTCMRVTALAMATRFYDVAQKALESAEALLAEPLDPMGLRSTMQSIDAAQKISERFLKLTGQISTQVDVVRSPIFKAAYRAAIDALDPWPEAQDAMTEVVKRFAGESEDD